MDNLNRMQQCCKFFLKKQSLILFFALIAYVPNLSATNNDTTFVRCNDGKIIPLPAWDSPEAAFITPREIILKMYLTENKEVTSL